MADATENLQDLDLEEGALDTTNLVLRSISTHNQILEGLAQDCDVLAELFCA